jgi:protein tyrosine phosphatase (PTP) superfamily phosphohydrolase (DUF442 family)
MFGPNSEMAMDPSRRKTLLRRALLVVLGLVACEQIWRHGHDYVLPKDFAAVEPGRIYRGAWQQDWPMRQIVRNHQIKTIVALAHQPDNPLAVEEKALAEELGVRWVHIPIVDTRDPGDPTVSERLAAAAAVIADPANQPVFFHCHHGINRASMVQMAYRMIYCGWDLDRAQDEIARTFGLRKVDKGPDYRHMASFYETHVLPLRQRQARADAPDTSTTAPR